jgi:hypothetical protein
MTRPTKKLTRYQRGSRDLRIYRTQKAADRAKSEAPSRARLRGAIYDVDAREARHNAAMIADAVHQVREQASRDSVGMATFVSWKIFFWVIILLLWAHR